jgi:hypothetical protein
MGEIIMSISNEVTIGMLRNHLKELPTHEFSREKNTLEWKTSEEIEKSEDAATYIATIYGRILGVGETKVSFEGNADKIRILITGIKIAKLML